MSELRGYGTAGVHSTILLTAESRNAQVNPTLAAGDVQVSLDDGAFANITTLPQVLPAGGTKVKISISAAELSCQRLMIRFKDVAGAEWEEQTLLIETYGNASAMHPNIGLAYSTPLTAQQTRNAMALASTAGAPASDSIDDKLDDLKTQITPIGTDIDTIDARTDSINTTVTNTNIVVTNMSSTVSNIDTNVAVINTNVNTLGVDVGIVDDKVDVIDVEVGVINGKVDSIQTDTNSIESKVDIIDTVADSIKVDTTQILVDIAALDFSALQTAIDDLAAIAALEATSQSILTGVSAIVARLPLSGRISNFNPITETIDGIAYSYIFELVAALVNGRYALDTPSPCNITFYKRDNVTPLTVVTVAETGRTRIS